MRPNSTAMILDDPREIARLDAGGMLGLVARFGSLLIEGWALGERLDVPVIEPSAIVTAGLGGSRIGGLLLRSLLAEHAPVPILPVADDRLPAFVGARTLAFVCSYSGGTEEALAAFDAARARGAAVVALASGGGLAQRARAAGTPAMLLPAGLPPRAAMPAQLGAMLGVVARLGLSKIGRADADGAASALDSLARTWSPQRPTATNAAKGLASRLHGLLPIIYAASPDLEPVAYRWKTQINENAELHAFWNVLPELSHNEAVGWSGVTGAGPGFGVVILREGDEGDRIARQVEALRQVALGAARVVEDVRPQGTGPLARVLSLVLLGDFVSVYLAILAGVDPTPVVPIARIKQRMQEAPARQGKRS